MAIEIEQRPAHSRGRYGIALALLIAFGVLIALLVGEYRDGTISDPENQSANRPQKLAQATKKSKSQSAPAVPRASARTRQELHPAKKRPSIPPVEARKPTVTVPPFSIILTAEKDGRLRWVAITGGIVLEIKPAQDQKAISRYITDHPDEFAKMKPDEARKEAAVRLGEDRLFEDLNQRVARFVKRQKELVGDQEILGKRLKARIIFDYNLHYRYLIKATSACRGRWTERNGERVRQDLIKNIEFVRPAPPPTRSETKLESGRVFNIGYMRDKKSGEIISGPYIWIPGVVRGDIKRTDNRWPNAFAWPADKRAFHRHLGDIKAALKHLGRFEQTTIVLRADLESAGGISTDIINECQQQGFTLFAFSAAQAGDVKKKKR